jgi:NAD(P)-dependent dehydrogenase (short-subunit alcohol dehydrogenase family)
MDALLATILPIWHPEWNTKGHVYPCQQARPRVGPKVSQRRRYIHPHDTFQFYVDLIRAGSVQGSQDADTTRAAYLAGKAAMIIWSSFLLDELAGLSHEPRPTCPSAAPTRRSWPTTAAS